MSGRCSNKNKNPTTQCEEKSSQDWNVKLEKAEAYLTKVCTKVSKELASSAFSRLAEENMEPHPGPPHNSPLQDSGCPGSAKVPKV